MIAPVSHGPIRWSVWLRLWPLAPIVAIPILLERVGFTALMIAVVTWCGLGVYLSLTKLPDPDVRKSRMLLNILSLAGSPLLLLVLRGLQNFRFHI